MWLLPRTPHGEDVHDAVAGPVWQPCHNVN
jgi:hypothetical protein